MLAVPDALHSRGWAIVNDVGEELPLKDLFSVEKKAINWRIYRAGRKSIDLYLQFRMFGPLGLSEDLRDIAYCEVYRRNLKLFFSRITSDEWRRELREFVYALDRL